MLIKNIYDQGSKILNEDELLISDNLFAVFDGASSLVKFLNNNNETGGKIAAKIAKEEFSRNNKSLEELALQTNNRIRCEMQEMQIDLTEKENLWSTVAAAVRIQNGKLEFFSIGDCFILAILKNDSYKLLTPYKDHDKETMKKWKKLAIKKEKNIRSLLDEDIKKVRREANLKYGCLNGETESINFFNSGVINLTDIKSIILFTDGLLIPKEEPEEYEKFSLFVDLYNLVGLQGILNYTRSIENEDPNCWKYPRFKQHDDIAAIGIDF